ncbi:hypothetical protein LZ906_004470 [Paraclostridium ghonii]|uniref:hypothetical protein n=1 Tax=Paraclostridium ghonii TaxID=29358 RepID=UPI00202CDFB9|nr:hypothetical protein [Paeniclostridium ghonii]MCM0166780.1 hypothetical protein [Paeniclostridium ghonii]
MDKYNKQGKFFLIVTTIVCVFSVYTILNGFNHNKLISVQWVILLGILFTSIANLIRNIKEMKIYYAIGALMITITVLIFYLVPQV